MPDFQNILVGEIFCAKSRKMPCMFCLVTDSNDEVVRAHVVTTGIKLQFSKATGEATCNENGDLCWVHSTSKLPKEHKNILLDMHRRFYSEGGIEKYRLLDAEKNTLVFLQRFYET